MRKLRVVFTTVGGVMPALLVAFVAPALDGCGSDAGGTDLAVPPATDASFADVDRPTPFEPSPRPPLGPECPSYIVEIPEPGTAADPGMLCAVPAPVASSNSASVILSGYRPDEQTAIGELYIAPDVEAHVVGMPTITVVEASEPGLESMTITEMQKAEGGFRFRVHWPEAIGLAFGLYGTRMTVQTSITLACSDGGTTTVEALTKIDLCNAERSDAYQWVSSGGACTVCHVIAEMAPSPIVSDKKGDDLPLGMVLRLRVVEVARAGRQILLFADNDAGPNAEYEWRVSEGSIEHIADDVILWTLPEDAGPNGARTPFGQVAVWNADGAAVENFVFSVAWQVAA